MMKDAVNRPYPSLNLNMNTDNTPDKPGNGAPSPLRYPASNPPRLPPTLQAVPFESPPGFLAVIEAVLKQPGRILHACKEGGSRVPMMLLAGTAVGLLVFGALLGTFSGGDQYWAAPLKVAGGALASMLICLPSLYIFSALGGVEARLSQVAGLLLAMMALTALLLLGFAPVVWIFASSTESLGFMGFLALAFWVISLSFGARLFAGAAQSFGARDKGYLVLWLIIFFIVTFQMSTSLRPIIGTAETFLPTKKMFFLEHWTSVAQGAEEDAKAAKGTAKTTRNRN